MSAMPRPEPAPKPMPPSQRGSQRDDAEIVIVREGRFKYRWTVAMLTGGRGHHVGRTFTARGARRVAIARIHGFAAPVFGRIEREEIRVAVQTSHASILKPEVERTELL